MRKIVTVLSAVVIFTLLAMPLGGICQPPDAVIALAVALVVHALLMRSHPVITSSRKSAPATSKKPVKDLTEKIAIWIVKFKIGGNFNYK